MFKFSPRVDPSSGQCIAAELDEVNGIYVTISVLEENHRKQLIEDIAELVYQKIKGSL